MRFKSEKVDGYQVFAITGTNIVSFAIDFTDADIQGLLGFAVERHDPEEDEQYFLYGFKVFQSVVTNPTPELIVSTRDHPIQSFVYDDFTAKPGRTYTYFFYPLKGKPKKLDRSAQAIPITIKTEAAFSSQEHDIFFNRGVASSQAYRRRFGNQSPDQLEKAGQEEKAREALDWLSRDLDDALLKFIDQAQSGDTLLGCFYEFRYPPAIAALQRAAKKRKVTLKIIIDAKENQTAKDPAFPREENLQQVATAGLKIGTQVLLRQARKNDIQHNKFMVLLKGATQNPTEVWTGSTNLSTGGIHGQTNVGHWVRNSAVAAKFKEYWDLLATDPGGSEGDTAAEVRNKNSKLRQDVADIDAAEADWQAYPAGITPIFSPRPGVKILEMYATLLDQAKDLACITLAFGINQLFKARLADNTRRDALTFFLLEREDKLKKDGDPDEFIRLTPENNTYMAFGSYLKEPMQQWAKETSAGILGLNRHVNFIHSKFLLKDPLSADPIVITGSANFSESSTNANDENMLFIRGNQRVADIYFTEFNRLFFHYYFRSIQVRLNRGAPSANKSADNASLFLDETDAWLAKYKTGSLRRKRVEAFLKMADAQTLDDQGN
jgi:phosphatidylserine/phosphatidylglycerophosphate/cardiolipin synthase-like enzyme